MANIKITELPSANALTGPEVLPLAQMGDTKKTTLDDIAQYSSQSITTQLEISYPDLEGVTTLSTTGIAIRLGPNSWTTRVINGTPDRIIVANGDGFSGDLIVNLADTYIGQSTITTLGTVTVGTWDADVISNTKGGAGTVNGLLKANGVGVVSAATASDYVAPGPYATRSTLTLSSNRLLGRSAIGTGPAEEIFLGSGLTLTSGVLNAETSTNVRIIDTITTSTTIDATYKASLLVINAATPLTITIRENTGDPALDWVDGDYVSILQFGTGQITVVAEGTGDITYPTDFQNISRTEGSVINLTCTSAGVDSWVLSGDLLRASLEDNIQSFVLADQSVLNTTNIATGTNKTNMFMPYDFVLEDAGVFASLLVAQTAGTLLTVDVNVNGTSILDTKLTFDNSEKTTQTAATQPVFTSAFITAGKLIAAGAEVSIDVDAVGTALAKGLKVVLVGQRA